ncbi:MAG: hypothetical protein IPK53_08195 [bacterium]|nr:hypothetical protein [bacterium]
MDPNEPRLPAPEDGRSPADLTKKELVAHLTAVEAIPQWKLNVMTRDAIVALFDMPRWGIGGHRRRRPGARPKTPQAEGGWGGNGRVRIPAHGSGEAFINYRFYTYTSRYSGFASNERCAGNKVFWPYGQWLEERG